MKKRNLLICHRNKVLFLPFVFMIFGSLFAQKNALDAKLQKIINGFVDDTLLYSASVSISIIDIESNKLIGSYDPKRSLVPASSLKQNFTSKVQKTKTAVLLVTLLLKVLGIQVFVHTRKKALWECKN